MPIASCRKRAAAPPRSSRTPKPIVNRPSPKPRARPRASAVYERYKKAPDVTRQRIYLETMERVLGGTDKTIIDTGGQPSPGVVPYLPLQNLPRERSGQQQQPAGGN